MLSWCKHTECEVPLPAFSQTLSSNRASSLPALCNLTFVSPCRIYYLTTTFYARILSKVFKIVVNPKPVLPDFRCSCILVYTKDGRRPALAVLLVGCRPPNLHFLGTLIRPSLGLTVPLTPAVLLPANVYHICPGTLCENWQKPGPWWNTPRHHGSPLQ